MSETDLTAARPDDEAGPDDDAGPVEARRLEPPPRVWLAALTALVLLSLVEVRWDGAVSWSLRATVVTAVLVAVIWLPSLLGLVARYGGTVSAAGVAFGIEAIRRVGSARPSAGEAPPGPRAQTARTGDGPLRLLEDEYETLRTRMPPSFQRSTALETILAEARLVASRAYAELAERLARFPGDGEGARIITVALLQAAPAPLPDEAADVLAEAVRSPRSTFEEYHALRAARDRRPDLGPTGAARVAAAVRQVLDRGGYPRGSDRLALARQVVSG